MAFQVASPTTPSTARPYRRWKARTAAAVLLPKLPSTDTEGMEATYWLMVLSQNCSCSTAPPREPVRRTVPPQVPSDRTPEEVSPSLVSSPGP